jgi:hypothetical protein
VLGKGGWSRAVKKILPIIIVLVLLAGGAGVAGYLGLMTKDSPAEGAESEPPQRVELHPFVISVLSRRGIRAHLTLVVTLEVAGEPGSVMVQRREPRLRDAFIKDLHALLPLKYDRPAFIEGEYLRQRLLRIAERTVGPGHVLAVRVRAMLRREMRQNAGA